MGKDFDYEILSVLRWVRRELVAESYGRGRVYMAGDAIHLTSPTGALGMNTGMQDAVDLGWKLDAVLKGWGGPNLLATYEIERKPVAVRNIKASTDNLERMLAPRTTHKPTAEMFQPGPAGDAARAKYGAWYTELMRHEWFMNGYHLGYRYDTSPIVWPDGTPAPPLEGQTYTQIARPGARAPHAWIGEGRSTLDLFGKGFVLLRLGDDAPSGEGIVRAFAAAGVPLRVEALSSPEVRKLYERALVLVRPDGHVAWRADKEPADATALADCVRGAGRLSQMQAVEGVVAMFRSVEPLRRSFPRKRESSLALILGPRFRGDERLQYGSLDKEGGHAFDDETGRLPLLHPPPGIEPVARLGAAGALDVAVAAAEVQAGGVAVRRRQEGARRLAQHGAGGPDRTPQPDPGQSDRGQHLRDDASISSPPINA